MSIVDKNNIIKVRFEHSEIIYYTGESIAERSEAFFFFQMYTSLRALGAIADIAPPPHKYVLVGELHQNEPNDFE